MKLKILFAGRTVVAACALEYLCKSKDVDVVGVLTDSHLDCSLTRIVAEKNKIRILVFEEALENIRKGNLIFELGISILYWRKFSEEFINAPRLGIINFHPAPLPEYKGLGGYNLAILEELEEWAVTAHYVNKDLDAGEIIDSLYFPIDKSYETVASLISKCRKKMFNLFLEIFKKLLKEKDALPSFPNVGGKYTSLKDLEGLKEILPNDNVSRKVRAFWFPPYNGAYIKINNKKFTLVTQDILETLSDYDAQGKFEELLGVDDKASDFIYNHLDELKML